MNNHLFRIIIFFLLLPLAQHAQAQVNISISGKIIDGEDQQAVHRANVSISGKGIGTATNASGMFVLIIPAANLNDTLKVTCIGFKTKLLPISGLKDGADLNIALERQNNQLKEVTIAYYDPMKIIQKALDLIPQNYINHPHILRGFYRMYTFDENIPLQLSEAVFDLYNFGYADKRADLFRLIKSRNEKNNRDFSTIELGQKPNSVFEYDIINHLAASGFLSEEGLPRHQFEVTGIVDMKGYQAYEINFKEKPGPIEKTFRGKMYIDVKTHAFIYFDFGMSPSALEEYGFANFSRRSLIGVGNVNVGIAQDSSKVSYQQVGNKWVLSDVEGNDVLNVGTAPAHVKFNYQITAVDTAQKESFTEKIGRGQNINAYKSSESEKFWKDYNILLSDYNTEDVFKQLEAINKALKEK